MKNHPSDEPHTPLLSKDQYQELLEQLETLVELFRGKGHVESSSDEEAQDAVLREIQSWSDKMARHSKKQWTSDDDKLWDRLVDTCYEMEIKSLKQQGYTLARAKKLVKRGWARWDPDSSRFIEPLECPGHKNVVPVVLVQREGGFSIHGEILPHLWDHPLLAEDLAGRVGLGTKAFFMSTLNRVESIEQKHHLDDWEHIPLLAEQEGPDRIAAQCVIAAADLKQALDSDLSGGSGGDLVIDDGNNSERESLAWLTEAKGGTQLWQLLNTAIKFGQTLNHYTTFQDTRIEEAVQRVLTGTPGKESSPEGKAVEKIIECFSKDHVDVTPTNLLKWLGGERMHHDGDALKVDHALWGRELKDVSWDRFQNLVKGAKRRL
ncbi:MAG: hypothetical protein ACJAVK_000844 [Akkermansiaceae bacterium]|jgi:hypothetical protein